MPNVTSAASIPQSSSTCMKDTTAPPKLGVQLAKYGNFVPINRSNRIDPLVLHLSNVEPNCSLEIINLSKNPAACWDKDAQTLPAKLKRPICDGKYGLLLGNKDAAKVSLNAGDIFEIRQVDPAGNASEPVRITLDQKTGADRWTRLSLDARVRDDVGAGLNPGQYNFMPDADNRPPIVLPDRMKIEAAKAKGKATLRTDRAVEPGCTVTIENARTHESYSATADGDGKLVVEFEAAAGDPLHIRATDHNGISTDMGMTTFAPTCVRAGPGAQSQLSAADQAA